MWEAGYSATDTGFCREIISIKREVESFYKYRISRYHLVNYWFQLKYILFRSLRNKDYNRIYTIIMFYLNLHYVRIVAII